MPAPLPVRRRRWVSKVNGHCSTVERVLTLFLPFQNALLGLCLGLCVARGLLRRVLTVSVDRFALGSGHQSRIVGLRAGSRLFLELFHLSSYHSLPYALFGILLCLESLLLLKVRDLLRIRRGRALHKCAFLRRLLVSAYQAGQIADSDQDNNGKQDHDNGKTLLNRRLGLGLSGNRGMNLGFRRNCGRCVRIAFAYRHG
jgi:hypothetical protein